MVDVSQYESKVTDARRQLESERRSLAERQREVQMARSKLQNQSVIRQTSPVQRQKFFQSVSQVEENINKYNQALNEFEQNELNPAEQSIQSYKKQVSDFKTARQLANKGLSLKGKGLSKEARAYGEAIAEGRIIEGYRKPVINLPEGAVGSAVGGGFLYAENQSRILTERDLLSPANLVQKNIKAQSLVSGDEFNKPDTDNLRVIRIIDWRNPDNLFTTKTINKNPEVSFGQAKSELERQGTPIKIPLFTATGLSGSVDLRKVTEGFKKSSEERYTVENYNKLAEELNTKYSSNISEGQFVGTPEEYDKYSQDYGKVEEFQSKLKESSFRYGAGSLYFKGLSKLPSTYESAALVGGSAFIASQGIVGGKAAYSGLGRVGKSIVGGVSSGADIYFGYQQGKVAINQEVPAEQRIIAGAGTILAGTSLGLKVGKVIKTELGYPKLDTRFISKDVNRIELPDGQQQINSRYVAITTKKNILSPSRSYVSGGESSVILNNVDDVSRFKSGTRGIIYQTEPTLDLVTGKYSNVYKNAKKFGAVQVGTISPQEINVALESTGSIRKPIEEGFKLQALGKSRVGNKKISYFISKGYGGNIDDTTSFLGSKSAGIEVKRGKVTKVLKTGREFALGIIKRKNDETEIKTISATKLLRDNTKTDEVLKTTTIQNVESAIKSTFKPAKESSKIPKSSATFSATQELIPVTKSLYAGTGQYERQELIVMPLSLVRNLSWNSEDQGSKSGLKTSSEQLTKVKQSNIQPQTPITIQPQGSIEIPILGSSQVQIPIQKQIQKPQTVQITVPQLKTKSGLALKSLERKPKISKEQAQAIMRSWDVYVKSKGKYKKIADNLPRNVAEKFGADYVQKTIAARFKLIGDDSPPSIKKDIEYEPDSKVFRTFVIKGKSRIPLKDEWIQKSGSRKEPTVKGARLRARSEVKEIIGLSRKKKFRFF